MLACICLLMHLCKGSLYHIPSRNQHACSNLMGPKDVHEDASILDMSTQFIDGEERLCQI